MIRSGECFAGYELAERIGDNQGLGVLYKARDTTLQRPVALRIIPPDLAGDAVTRARLNRESTILASIAHANVAPIYDAGTEGDFIFIATQWVDGTRLNTLARKQAPMATHRAVGIVNQIASALQTAHDHGVVHRDVKPPNVLVSAADHAYLTNFAVARRSSDVTGLTRHEQLLSDFDYMPPEYIRGTSLDWRADIYGLGCLLYDTLTAEVPFPRDGTPAKMYAHLSAETPSVRQLRPDVSPQLDEVVGRAMAKEPADRQSSAAQFALEAARAAELPGLPWAQPSAPRSAGGSDGTAVAEPARVGDHAGFSAPHIYRSRRRRPAPRFLLWLLGSLVFFAPPVGLMIAMHSA